MHIQKIRTLNWKGSSTSLELSPLTVIVGPNMAGKSAIHEAIRVGLIGYSPKHGKRASQTFGFIGAKEGAKEGALTLDFGDRVITHRWKLKGGKINYEGPDPLGIPPVLLDFSEYLTMNGKEKIRYIFAEADLSKLKLTLPGITARLKQEIQVDVTEESEAALLALAEDIADFDTLRVANDWSVQEWVGSMMEHCKDKRNSLMASITAMVGTIQGTSQLQAGAAAVEFDAESLASLEAHFQRVTNDLSVLTATRARNSDILAQRRRIEGQLEMMAKEEGSIIDLRSKVEALEEDCQGYQTQTPVLVERLTQARLDAARIKREIANNLNTLSALSDECKKRLQDDCCPFCRTSGEVWKKSYKAHMNGRMLVLTEANEKLDKDLAGLSDLTVIEAELLVSQKADMEFAATLNEFKTLKRALDSLVNQAAERIRLESTLSALEVQPMLDPLEIQNMTELRDALAARIQELRQSERMAVAQAADLRRVEEAKSQLKALEAGAEVCAGAVKVFAEIQKECMEKSFGTILETANLFTDGILKGRLEFREGEVGYLNGASWVAFDYFSGTEDLLSAAGLAVAMCQRSPIKIVLMDELGRLHPELKQKVVSRMGNLISLGTIDQFIGLDVTRDSYSSVESLNLITL